jgi:hypothetical protein
MSQSDTVFEKLPDGLLEAKTLEEFLRQKYEVRNATYKLRQTKYFEPLENLQERIAVGLLSWTLLDRHERWIRPSALLHTQFGLQTASEVARDYLDFKFPKRLRALGPQAEVLKLHRAAPLYCWPGIYDEYCYLDLKSAFYSIMCLAGWDVDYFPAKWLVPGTTPVDFPLSGHKVARNCLVSCALPTPMKLWTGYRFVRRRANNPHINLGLWSLIMDILNCIAREATECEAVYIHTDGYIIPLYRAYELQERIAEYGLIAEIKLNSIGTCIMLGMGNWKCGERKTKRFNKAHGMGRVDTIYKMDNVLLKRKLAKFRQKQLASSTLS